MSRYGNAGSELIGLLSDKNNITANITKSRLTETALDLTNIFQTTASDCTNFDEIAIYDCGIKDVSILQKGMCKLNIKDRMNTNVQSNINQKADFKSKQYAKDVIQGVGINPGSENAVNIGNISADSTATIQTRIDQICTNVATNVNTFTCQNVDGLYGDYIAQDSIVDSTVDCALSADIINNTTQKMEIITDQYASATRDDALTGGVLGMFAIYIAWIINGVLIGSDIINVILIFIVIGLIVAMGGIYWYYYHYKHNPRPFGDRCADCTKFASKKKCEAASCKWTGSSDDDTVSNPDYPSLDPKCECDPAHIVIVVYNVIYCRALQRVLQPIVSGINKIKYVRVIIVCVYQNFFD